MPRLYGETDVGTSPIHLTARVAEVEYGQTFAVGFKLRAFYSNYSSSVREFLFHGIIES